MKIAILGVGLIGGSIGLAARERLGAEVCGFDPHAGDARGGARGRRRRRGRGFGCRCGRRGRRGLLRGAGQLLPELVAEALAASGPEAVVSDVGSTKVGLIEEVAGLEQAPRFIGGHPAGRSRDRGRAQLARRPVRRRPLVPDSDGVRGGRPVRSPAQPARRPRRAATGARSRRARPDDGHRQPPAARARQRARRPRGADPGGRRAPARARPQLPRLDAGRRRQPRDLGRDLRRQRATGSPTRSTR